MLSRRSFMAALASASAAPAFAQHAGHDPVYSNLVMGGNFQSAVHEAFTLG